jgi:hypothetical protein
MNEAAVEMPFRLPLAFVFVLSAVAQFVRLVAARLFVCLMDDEMTDAEGNILIDVKVECAGHYWEYLHVEDWLSDMDSNHVLQRSQHCPILLLVVHSLHNE